MKSIFESLRWWSIALVLVIVAGIVFVFSIICLAIVKVIEVLMDTFEWTLNWIDKISERYLLDESQD